MNGTSSSGDYDSAGSQGPVSQGSAGPGQPWPGRAAPHPAAEGAPHRYAPTEFRHTQGAWPESVPYPQTWAAPPYPGPWQQPKKGKRIKIIAGFAISVVVLLMGVGAWFLIDESKPDFEVIGAKCDNDLTLDMLLTLTGAKQSLDDRGVEMGDDYWAMVPGVVTVNQDLSSIGIDQGEVGSVDKIEYISGLSGTERDEMESVVDRMNGARDLAIMSAIDCVHDELDIPESVNTRMLSTRALDGMQEVTHNNIRVSWNYHPWSGLNVIYEKE